MIVYQHRRLDTNEVFYIGIGKSEKRAYNVYQRNSHWHNVVNKVGHKVEIITTCDTWEECCEIEKYLIKYYGRYDLGTGPLVNKTEGGDGSLGFKFSDESRLRMSKSAKGRVSPNKGKKASPDTRLKQSLAKKGKPSPKKGIPLSEDVKLKMSLSKKGCAPTVVQGVLDTQTGVFYESIAEASFYYDIKRTTLGAMLRGQNKNRTNLIII